jgi:hypothetical protein
MMAEKQEITAGLKQAVEKGYNIETVKRSFINAGYSKEDVEDSSRVLLGYASTLPPLPTAHLPTTPIMQKPLPPMPLRQPTMPPKQNHRMTAFVIILIVVLVFLLGVLIASIFWKEKVIEVLSSMGINLS